jgi:O-antigen/teichoic acid export membrane protein
MLSSSLVKNAIFYSIGEILPRALSFILLPIYTCYLSPADYGITSYTQTIISFLSVLGAMALNTYALRYYFIYKTDEKRKEMLGSVHLSIVLVNLIILAVAFVLMPGIVSYYHIQVPWDPYFKLAFITNFFECLSFIPLVVYRVRQDAVKFVLLGFSRTLFSALLTVYFLVVEKRGVIGVFQAQLYVIVPYSFVYLYIIWKYSILKINLNYLKEGINYSAPLIPSSICYMLLSTSDRVILERNVTMDELGIYNVAFQIALVLSIVIRSGYLAIEPELFSRFGKDGFYDFIRKAQSVYFCTIYVMALALSLFSQELLYMMTSKAFHGGYILVPALMVGVIMTGQNVIYNGILHGEKRTKVSGAATIVGAIVSVAVNLILVPIYGTYAAAAASAFSFMVMNTILFYAMTYPGKTMLRETLLVLMVPIFSYFVFFMIPEVCVLGALLKTIVILFYCIITSYLLKVKRGEFKLFVK